MLIIAAKFQCKTDKVDELVALAGGLLEPSRSEEGCISYAFHEDRFEKDSFLFFEEWRSQEDIDKHFEKPYFLAFMERFSDLIIGEPDIKIYQIDKMEKV